MVPRVKDNNPLVTQKTVSLASKWQNWSLLTNSRRRYKAEILPMRRKTRISNQSLNLLSISTYCYKCHELKGLMPQTHHFIILAGWYIHVFLTKINRKIPILLQFMFFETLLSWYEWFIISFIYLHVKHNFVIIYFFTTEYAGIEIDALLSLRKF